MPCGSEYSHCKFIKDAYDAAFDTGLKPNKSELALKINKMGESKDLQPEKIKKYIDQHSQILEKKNKVASDLASDQIQVEKNNMAIMKFDIEIDDCNSRLVEYENNKDVIENLEELIKERAGLLTSKAKKSKEHDKCQEELSMLYKQHGSLEQQLKTLEEQKQTLRDLSLEYAVRPAYVLLSFEWHFI